MKTVINLEKIEGQMKSVLKQYGHSYTDEGVSKVASEWLKAKTPLIEILEKNPNWDSENLSIVIQQATKRATDEELACRVISDLFEHNGNFLSNRLNVIDEAVRRRGGDGISYDNGFYYNVYKGATEEEAKEVDKCYSLYQINRYLRNVFREISQKEGSEITQDDANSLDRFIHIRGIAKVGQKKTRAFRAIFKELGFEAFDGYERLYAKLADSLTEKQFFNCYHISVHPLDYLLMSNGNSWRSCHMIDGGCYQVGTVSYLLDEGTVVFYNTETHDGNKTDYALLPKLSRNLFMISRNRNVVLQSRAYPSNNESIRELNRNVFQEQWALSLGIQNSWVKFSVSDSTIDNYIDRKDGARNYRDYREPGYRTLFRVKGLTVSNKERPSYEEKMQVGVCPICFECGGQDPRRIDSERLICDECFDADIDWGE